MLLPLETNRRDDLKLLTGLHHRHDPGSGSSGTIDHRIKEVGIASVGRGHRRDIMRRKDQPPARFGVESNDVFDEPKVVPGSPIQKERSKKIQIDKARIRSSVRRLCTPRSAFHRTLDGHVWSIERIRKHAQPGPWYDSLQSCLVRTIDCSNVSAVACWPSRWSYV